MLSMFTSR